MVNIGNELKKIRVPDTIDETKGEDTVLYEMENDAGRGHGKDDDRCHEELKDEIKDEF